jgi:HK97 family phage major capsid protein
VIHNLPRASSLIGTADSHRSYAAYTRALQKLADQHARAALDIREEAPDTGLTASQAREVQLHNADEASLLAEVVSLSVDYNQDIGGTRSDTPVWSNYGSDDRRDDRNAVRRAADTGIANLNRDGLLADAGAEMVTRLMERGHQGERGLTAAWAAATSDPAYIRAFGKYVTDPQNVGAALTEEERAAYQRAREVRGWVEGTPASAGWLVPITLDASVMLTGAGVRSPIRNVARVEQITSDRWRGISSAGTTAEWKAEAVAATPVTPSVAVPEVPVHFLSVFTKFSLEIEQDGLRLLENLQEIQTDAAITKTETAYATGTGVGEPAGLVTGLAAVAASVIAPTTAEVFGKLDLIKLQNDLGPRFQPNASFLLALKMINEAAVLEISAGGSLAYPEIRNGRALNRAVYEMSTVDSAYDAAVTQAHNYLALYGDWRKCFLIADRVGSSVLEVIPTIFNSSGNPTGERGCWYHTRTGSGVIVPEAGRVLDIPTT